MNVSSLMPMDPRQLLAHDLTDALAAVVKNDVGSQASEVNSTPLDLRTKPISFSPELVRAIFAGRKTETRRLIRPQPKRRPAARTCRIAQPGDLLHVREPWAQHEGRIVYAADGEFGVPRYRPAMYMARAASRLMLRVTTVRAQRLKAMSSDAARAEGAPSVHADPIFWFAGLWDRIFTAPGERWADNPLVWVVEFERVIPAAVAASER